MGRTGGRGLLWILAGLALVGGVLQCAPARAASVVPPGPPPVPLIAPDPPPTPIIPLAVGNALFSLFTFNPTFTTQDMGFTLATSTPARVTITVTAGGDARVMRAVDLGQRRSGTVEWSWNGRDDAGHPVPEGVYSYHIAATNGDGEHAAATYNGLGVTYKRIVVSLSQQRLTAYDGDSVFLSTLVTTGNAALPTPPGVYPILARCHPFTFKSPWPAGSLFYYPPLPVQYALLFDNRGYYVHDAPWRAVFGPGSNAALGKPGQNFTGTHGCVNVPPFAEEQLFFWSTIGTIVQVIP
ncbi:MAG: hypothetical protein NVSMB65_20170 [Chloroflexota bacterium]